METTNRKPKVYPLEIRAWASGGWYSYGHHDYQDFMQALAVFMDEPIASVNGFIQEYGYNVPSTHYSDYSTMWYSCDGPQRGARPITMCYEVGIQTEDGVMVVNNDRD